MSDSKWAQQYLIDPLNAPGPSEETGPGSHFGSTVANSQFGRQSANLTPPGSAKDPHSPSKNPFRDSTIESKPAILTRNRSNSSPTRSSYPSPPNSATHSPRNSKNPFELHASEGSGPRGSFDSPSAHRHSGSITRPRGNSLGARYPGDESNKPLDIIRRESKRANRAPHLRKKHLPGPDLVDRLDDSIPVGGMYHHEGPYDATLLARNTSFNSSPVAAVQGTNEAALKATPRENVLDAIDRHRPLDGVAIIPPGQQDRFGRQYDYPEGENMMIDLGGNYKRWPGMDYHPDDIKGKGEPQFSIDRAHKEAKRRSRGMDANTGDIEMTDTVRPKTADPDSSAAAASVAETSSGAFLGRSASTKEGNGSGKRHFSGLKKRIGSLKKRLD